LYAAGDFRLLPFQILGQSAVLAVRGNWTFTDEQAVKQIQAIVGVVRNFWHDNRFPYFLVTLAPYDQKHGSSDGSQFTNAFWMFVSNRDSIDGLLPQLAHESFHAWNPGRMGFIPSGYDERYIGWFHEGATEYYAQLLTFKAGYISPEGYVASLNKDLRRFPDSSDNYVRGRIISLWLDGTIRQESNQRPRWTTSCSIWSAGQITLTHPSA
jgi:predicted metalloprotease with PDZ domain